MIAIRTPGTSYCLFQFILVFSFVQYRPISLGDYVFPAWADRLGWFIAVLPVLPIPAVAILKMRNTEGATLKMVCLFVNCGLTSLLKIYGHITTVPTCSSDTLTNVLPHMYRNVIPQTQDMPPHSVIV